MRTPDGENEEMWTTPHAGELVTRTPPPADEVEERKTPPPAGELAEMRTPPPTGEPERRTPPPAGEDGEMRTSPSPHSSDEEELDERGCLIFPLPSITPTGPTLLVPSPECLATLPSTLEMTPSRRGVVVTRDDQGRRMVALGGGAVHAESSREVEGEGMEDLLPPPPPPRTYYSRSRCGESYIESVVWLPRICPTGGSITWTWGSGRAWRPSSRSNRGTSCPVLRAASSLPRATPR